MGRLFLYFLILASFLISGCSDKLTSGSAAQSTSSWDPRTVFMANHIRMAHGFSIGSELFNDLIIEYDGGSVGVQFSEAVAKQTNGQINHIFKTSDTSVEISKKEYLIFLAKLHAYLNINPVRDGFEN